MTMNRPFIHDDFLLHSEPARELYHRYAAPQPIIDYHNHLPPEQIAANHQFADLTELWLAGDHYKWRAMRANGIPERFITGDASPKEKFKAWAKTVPYTLGNPLYHWTHLELVRHFGIARLLDEDTADAIWDEAHARLSSLRVHDVLERHQVRVLCTTDDPAESLEHHQAIRAGHLKTRVYPTYRPDRAVQIQQPDVFNRWVEQLASITGLSIRTLDDFLSALKKRHDDFHELGCRLSDHGLENLPTPSCSPGQAEKTFQKVRSGKTCTPDEQAAYVSYLMVTFGRWHAARGWTMQLHLGAQRNNNTRFYRLAGPNTGFDSIGDYPQARNLSQYLDLLDETNELPRTILYNLNPADNYVFATLAGNFQDGSVPGKVQFGSGWWFLDQKEGMEWQLNALSNIGLLRRFIGMTTDSRSFLSFPRHEYFRRVLCNLLGQGICNGEIPNDLELLGKVVTEISFSNARDYFAFALPMIAAGKR